MLPLPSLSVGDEIQTPFMSWGKVLVVTEGGEHGWMDETYYLVQGPARRCPKPHWIRNSERIIPFSFKYKKGYVEDTRYANPN